MPDETFRSAFVQLAQDVQAVIEVLQKKATVYEHAGEWDVARAYRHGARILRRIHAGQSIEERNHESS